LKELKYYLYFMWMTVGNAKKLGITTGIGKDRYDPKAGIYGRIYGRI